jgi:hypothetical protein
VPKRCIYNSLDFMYSNALLVGQTGVPFFYSGCKTNASVYLWLESPPNHPFYRKQYTSGRFLYRWGSNNGILEELILLKLYPASPLGRES